MFNLCRTKKKERKIRKTVKSMPCLKNRSDVLIQESADLLILLPDHCTCLNWSLFAFAKAAFSFIFMPSFWIFQGISGHSFPEGYRLSFPTRTNYMYAVVKHSIPTLRAFTVCLWLRPAEGGIGTPLSYAIPAQPNELVLLQGLHTPTELLINDKVLYHSNCIDHIS